MRWEIALLLCSGTAAAECPTSVTTAAALEVGCPAPVSGVLYTEAAHNEVLLGLEEGADCNEAMAADKRQTADDLRAAAEGAEAHGPLYWAGLGALGVLLIEATVWSLSASQ